MKIKTLLFRAKLELREKLKSSSLTTTSSWASSWNSKRSRIVSRSRSHCRSNTNNSHFSAVFVFHCSGLNSTQWRQLKTLLVQQNASEAELFPEAEATTKAEIFFFKNTNKTFHITQTKRSYQKAKMLLWCNHNQQEKTGLQTVFSTQTRGPICIFYLSQESAITSRYWTNMLRHMEAANFILLYGRFRFVRINGNEPYNETICNHVDIKQSMNLQQIPVLTQALSSFYHSIQTLYYCLTFLTKNKSSLLFCNKNESFCFLS